MKEVQRAPVAHQRKASRTDFQAIISGEKSFQVADKNDEYQVGDRLLLKEWDPMFEFYTGREADLDITFIETPCVGLPDSMLVMAIRMNGD